MDQKTTIEFSERMSGYFIPHKLTLSSLMPLGREDFKSERDWGLRKDFEFNLTIKVPDLESFLKDHSKPSEIHGNVTDFRFGGELTVQKGYFQLFTKPSASPDLDTAKEMHYTIFLTDREDKAWTFFGFKEILRENPTALWSETTTLYFYLWEGHSTFDAYADKHVHAVGSLRIAAADFLQQMKSFKTNDSSSVVRSKNLLRYYKAFAGSLWESYAPFVFSKQTERWNEHQYPVHTTQGVAKGDKSIHSLDTRDGLTISLQRFQVEPVKDIVLLLHGLTTSTDMYIMPEHKNLVSHLHDRGYQDVWSLDWRGSGRFTYNIEPHLFTIDDVAKYDIPAAVEYVRSQCGDDVKIHVIAHCVGSIAFMASYAAGYVSGITSIISNSVSLTPQVPWPAMIKMLVGPEAIEAGLRYPYVSPKIPYYPGRAFGKALYWLERTIRHECKEPACHMISFMWGWGFPAAFNHRNIHPVTHRRLMDLFGGTSFHYHKHIRKMLLAKAAVSFAADSRMNYLEEMKTRKLPPTLFISGSENRIFPEANKKTYEALQETPNAENISYKEFQGYGHQDIFMGQYCESEVFPHLVKFLDQHREAVVESDTIQKVYPKLRIA